MDLDSGKITIDGIDISRLGVKQLRSRMAIIPQVPSS
jgi:ABC-type multidrug transport system fused ATPase/permease subunit